MPPNLKAVFAALAAVATAVISVLTVFEVVDWSAAQTALVTTEAGALLGLTAAVTAHLLPGTKQEPVALAAAITAFLSATIALGSGFDWWEMTAEQTAALVSLVSAIFGIGLAWLARSQVTAEVTDSA